MIKGDKNTEYKEMVMTILELSDDTSPVELSFGYVSESGICRKGIILKKAAPRILTELIQRGYSATVTTDGVHINDFRN